MKTREEYIALIASHAGELQNTFGITSLRLFGSVARNEHHEGSDVDVYVEMPPKFFLVVRLKAYLEELLDNPVDIIRKHQHLNPFLLKEIRKVCASVHFIPPRLYASYATCSHCTIPTDRLPQRRDSPLLPLSDNMFQMAPYLILSDEETYQCRHTQKSDTTGKT